MTNLTRKFDLTSLRLFLAVYLEQNIARAAERECITPSAVSRRISDLELLIGAPLIHRQSRGISVTPVGEMLARHARAVLESLENLNAEISQFQVGAKGSVKIAANLSAIVQFLPEDLASFQRTFPEVDIRVDEIASAEVLRSVEEGTAEIGICNAQDLPAGMEARPYRADRLVLIVPPRHRLASLSSVDLGSITQERLVGLGPETSLMKLLNRQAAEQGLNLSLTIQVRSLDVLCRMVHAELGVAVVPQLVAEYNTRALDLKIVPITEAWATRKLIVVSRESARLTATARGLISYLADH
ncbi:MULTISPECIES: LysR substrate-binding domain-containing protein [Pseudomonas]|uniref:LysR substrate-binding domain-containing protein n=1 Tax=Pseudomonas TaxID=286 RepID=UPI0018A9161F|nr:LysR substrate-binding domain-containing protein [Pseudomonas guariconensis]MBF8724082.1 LysR family transcriptional regulator [Pseudomonas guariconensis]MBF8740322.1 LysR family transcriptional regulator [Pseudomonas guariconensis]MBF8749636.1 LysR family transcriptional regulator [Pseudomonas guariconensis]MBF8794369.1 LysR family transcriptional regulator [Pseudomonas monteilii]